MTKNLQNNDKMIAKIHSESLVFTSDQCNEVGHDPKNQAGYRVPIVMWDSRDIVSTGVDKTTSIGAAQWDEKWVFN
ncbi:MAG: hypothetical protein Q4B82_08325 [Alysiella sp.]|uniref:hypothetical protein n=1 Tax=Alysiella sp. TaxID=1872483 RepID=UPI0026DC9407|nr:hypothetical protein [Alysiella sp.]MDO4434567.1 hypothetical protein [Alysiella sp.]